MDVAEPPPIHLQPLSVTALIVRSFSLYCGYSRMLIPRYSSDTFHNTHLLGNSILSGIGKFDKLVTYQQFGHGDCDHQVASTEL